jgi:hypothetical protein
MFRFKKSKAQIFKNIVSAHGVQQAKFSGSVLSSSDLNIVSSFVFLLALLFLTAPVNAQVLYGSKRLSRERRWRFQTLTRA